MPRSSKTLPSSRAKTTRSKPPSVSVMQRNANAHELTQTSVMSRLECIGSTIIDELKGLQRDHLKQQLISTSRSNTTTHSHFSFSPTRRSLRDVLDVMHSFEDYTQRQCRSVAVGENFDVTNKSKKNNTISNDGSQRLTTLKRTEKLAASLNPVSGRASSSTTRTICTRSSTLKMSDNNQALGHQAIPSRTRKRRTSAVTEFNELLSQTDANAASEATCVNTLSKSIEEMCGVKVLRKKIESSDLSTADECPNTSIVSTAENDF